jgi:hypothetical protein
MKRPAKRRTTEELRPKYDFSKGERGKHFGRYAEGRNMALLAPDVAKVFRDSDAVNSALRMLIDIAGKATASGKTRNR